jgi:flagellar basal-body rod protein FlgB
VNLTDVPLLIALRERMSWLNSRQTLLAQNVANADTPGYAARDLKPMDFQAELDCRTAPTFAGIATTDARHITVPVSGSTQSTDGEVTRVETTPTGNSVSLEEEMIKVADTQSQYQAASNLYAKTVGMMRTAIGSV